MTTCSQAGRGEGWEVGGTTTLPSSTQQNQPGILADIKMVLDREEMMASLTWSSHPVVLPFCTDV